LTRLVVDATAAIYLASMADVTVLDRHECLAPPLMWSESVSALSEAAYRGQLPPVELVPAIERLEQLPITSAGGRPEDRRAALEIAQSLGWAKTYDAEYVALARSLGCAMLSIDMRLIQGAARLVDFVGPGDL